MFILKAKRAYGCCKKTCKERKEIYYDAIEKLSDIMYIL